MANAPPVVRLLCQPQSTGHDPHDSRPRRVPAFGCVGVQFGNHGGEAVGSQTERGSGVTRALGMAARNPRQCAANRCRPGAAKEFPRPLRVPGYAIGFALADLHGGSSEVNEPLNEPGFWSGSAQGVPETLPCLVRLPVPAAVKEVQGVEPLGISGERGHKNAAAGGGVSWKVSRENERAQAAVGLSMGGGV